MASEKNANDKGGKKGNFILIFNLVLTGALLLEVTLVLFDSELGRYGPFASNSLSQTSMQDMIIPREFFSSLIATAGNVCHHEREKVKNCNSALPNFFLSSDFNGSEQGDKDEAKNARHQYEKSVITFVHAPKCGGTTMKHCMNKLAKIQGKPAPHLLHKDGRFSAQIAIKNGDDSIYRSRDMFMGGDSWGFCSFVEHRNCSYFTIVREPYDRLVSLYFECRKQNYPPGVGRANCVQIGIVDWIVQVKPLLSWYQLHRTVECANDDVWSCSFRVPRRPLEQLSYNDTYIKSITDNLEKVFAVIGITEDYATTCRLLQATYGVPFYDKCNGIWLNTAVYTDHDIEGFETFDSLKGHLKGQLRNNSDIRRMIYADVKLYEKAKEIFEKQKEILDELGAS